MTNSVIPLTIVIPAFGRQEGVARAVASIAAQEVLPEEVIIVDDASTPPLVVGDERGGLAVRVLRQPENRGPAAARNAGIAAARSAWLSFLDSDDVLLPGTLGERWRMVEERARADHGLIAYACGWTDVDPDGKPLGVRIPRETDAVEDFASGCWFSPGSCVIMNRDATLAAGVMQDESLRRFEDFDWFLALALAGLRLRTLPVVGVAVERQRRQSPAAVEAVAAAIIRKWREALPDERLNARIRAYMHLECAAANFYAGNRLRAAGFLAGSLAAKPRLGLQLSPGWEMRSSN